MTLYQDVSYLFCAVCWWLVFCVYAADPGERAILRRMEEVTAYLVVTGLSTEDQLKQARAASVLPARPARFWEWRRIRHERLEFWAHSRVGRVLHDAYMVQLDANIAALKAEGQRLRALSIPTMTTRVIALLTKEEPTP